MASMPLRNLAGDDLGELEVSDSIFAAQARPALVHQAALAALANRRLGTHKTKTRGNVSGGGAKPWRQKSTGRARQGSRVSPLWRGGGVTFGPTPRGYKQDLPKKMKQAALRSALTARLEEGAVFALDNLDMEAAKTREMANNLANLGLDNTVVLVDEKPSTTVRLASRNLGNVEVREAASLSLLDVIQPQHVLLTRSAVQTLESRLAFEGHTARPSTAAGADSPAADSFEANSTGTGAALEGVDE